MSCQRISHTRLSLIWTALWLFFCCWISRASASAPGQGDYLDSPGSLSWLLSDKGPFHQSWEFSEAAEREFGRWKVNNLALEKRDSSSGSGGLSPPLDPEFMHMVRQLGRRPSLQTITESLIKKYGTHVLISATLGGEESLTIFVDKRRLNQESQSADSEVSNKNSNWTGAVTLETLHHLAASYFTDRESTLRKLHHLQIASSAIRVTETRTGPLGCSNYDNLDTVSSVLVHSPENKVQLQGLQVLLPLYLQSRFIQAALDYIGCKSEGEFVCQRGDCWCRCNADFPHCNCPLSDLESLQNNLLRIQEAWRSTDRDFEQSEEFRGFVERLPKHYAVNTSVVEHLWRADASLLQRYRQLEANSLQLVSKARRTAHKLFSLSKRCRQQPKIVLPQPSQESHSCSCPYAPVSCQGVIPCSVGDSSRCTSCSTENRTRLLQL
uniref:MACPF domain-containing protein n=1 Tax=Knipowitschia caucasica TaxID=637954 RepID=A0AAV2JT77_KNICA